MKNETIKINIQILNIKTCTNEMKEQLALALHTKLSNQSVSGISVYFHLFTVQILICPPLPIMKMAPAQGACQHIFLETD